MDTNAIKTFATWSRTHLRKQIEAKAARYGLTRTGIETPQFVSGGMTVAGTTYDKATAALYKQLQVTIDNRRQQGKPDQTQKDDTKKDRDKKDREIVEALIDEAAYTWFNRLSALRFMEVNSYTGRVLSSSQEGIVDPDLLRNATTLVSDGEFRGVTLDDLDAWRAQSDDVAYRNLLIAECRRLGPTLPTLFAARGDYAELFLPDNLLNKQSIVRRIVQDVPEPHWESVEIIGWLYQFYISELKEKIMAAKKPYEPPEIPPVTQLFTPRWIVRYMVENSLGRLWLEAHPDSALREQMPYYLESAEPAPVAPRPTLAPQDLRIIDPACGSSHILVYAFDLLAQIYREAGYADRNIAALILEHNLFGLDIDKRAIQLASFALLMKARAYSRHVFRDPPPLNLVHIVATRNWHVPDVPELGKDDWQPLLDAFEDADSLGGLITPPEVDYERLEAQLKAFEKSGRQEVSRDAEPLQHLLKQARFLSKEYDAVVANPPYIKSGRFNKTIKDFAEQHYEPYKKDLFSVSIVRYLELCKENGQLGFMTPFVWMFISSYEDLRRKIIDEHTLSSLVQLEYSGFDGATVPICTFTLRKKHLPEATGEFVRLSDFRGAENQGPKTLEAARDQDCGWRYTARPVDFEKIPGSPIAYWVSEKVLEVFTRGICVSDVASVAVGLQTGSNDRFVREWFEVDTNNTGFGLPSREAAKNSGKTWFPYNKGGSYRKWYGNQEFVVDWYNDGKKLFDFKPKSVVRNSKTYFHASASWSKVTSGSFVLRYFPPGFIYDVAGCSIFEEAPDALSVIMGVMNSHLVKPIFADLSPTLNFEVGQVSKAPLPSNWKEHTESAKTFVQSCIDLSKTDWDNFETSWDFQTHPLLRFGVERLEEAFDKWQQQAETAFFALKRLEEENNRYWIEAYGLQDELSPDVPEDEVTIRRADLERDVKSLLSYAVGCMMGRYSLAAPGLQFAGGSFDLANFGGAFRPDDDGIIPVTDQSYLADDITDRFVAFLRAAFGSDEKSLEANLNFVANALAPKSKTTALERIRNYFVKDFISDHNRTYSKRPIYWLFSSGPERAFGGLVYLHRYTPDTLATMRNSYVLPLQRNLNIQIEQVRAQADEAGSASATKDAKKELQRLETQAAELRDFQERLQHYADRRISLDLDDGVAYNYTLFAGDDKVGGIVYEGSDLKMEQLVKASDWKRELLAAEEED